MAVNTMFCSIYHFMVLLLLLQLVISKSNDFTLKLIHRDSIESPLYPGNLTLEERATRLHIQTDARIKFYAKKIAIAASAKLQVNQSENQLQPEVIRPRISFQDSYYLANVGIGTFDNLPPQRNYLNYFLMVDTGSNLIWTQCQPCEDCYPQAQPLFPYKRSSTYNLLPCNAHRLCYPNKCKDQICSYEREYVSGQQTSGYLGKDRFAFEVNNGSTDNLYYIVFGCGTNQKEMHFETTPNKINGILGMGSGVRSFVNQLGYRAQKRFSYCIPSRKNDNDNIYLRFGQEATFKHGQQVRTTPFVPGVLQTYYVKLLDISVDGFHLHSPPGYFDIKHDGSGGCVIDSGCPFTALPQGAYIWLKNVVTQYFAQMQLPTKQMPHFDLCFPVPGPHQPFPLITFHFANADLQVGTTAFVVMDDAICLAFSSSGEFGGGISAIIGGLAQSNYRFVFNLATSTVSFAIEDCRRTS